MKKIHFNQFDIIFLQKSTLNGLKLSINAKNQLILSAPSWVKMQKIHQFLAENENWMIHHTQNRPQPRYFTHGAIVPLLGQEYVIKHDKNIKQGVFIQNNEIIVSGEAQFLPRRITTFIKATFYDYAFQKAHLYAEIIGEKPHKITLRDTTSRWGSCSSSKNLSFCWRLAMAPLYVIDYIIAHEVAHLKYMNHSPDFWATVAQFNTQQSNAEIWLRKNGADLHLWQ